jgi:TonB family protein
MMRLVNSFLIAFVCLISLTAPAATSDWISAPKPWLQPRSVRKKAQASVKVRLMIANDGHVTESTIVKTSGEYLIDLAVKDVVLRWRMRPSAIKPSDLAEGRVVEFLVR